jgi:hypothetical protein
MSVNPTKLVLGVLAAPITALSAWLTASVAKYGVHLDASGVNAALIAGATCGITVMVKLIHDVETTIEHDPKAKQDIDDADVIAGLLERADPEIRKSVSDALAGLEQEVMALSGRVADTTATIPSPVARLITAPPDRHASEPLQAELSDHADPGLAEEQTPVLLGPASPEQEIAEQEAADRLAQQQIAERLRARAEAQTPVRDRVPPVG